MKISNFPMPSLSNTGAISLWNTHGLDEDNIAYAKCESVIVHRLPGEDFAVFQARAETAFRPCPSGMGRVVFVGR